VQRVSQAKVTVQGETTGAISAGLCVLVGVARDDTAADAASLAEKVTGLRIFEDAEGKMNLSLLDTGGALLAVSQFTLLGDVRRGKRPSFGEAMEPGAANQLFERFCARCREIGVQVETGRFRAHMLVELANVGPVTILLDTKKSF
jgi:D-tyrosyl-tRNA(Tyr) deacylase